MPFVIKKKDTFFWPVKLKSPVDGGTFEEQCIDLEFKKLKDPELQKLLKEKDNDKAFCKAIVVGWKDVKDEEGKEVPFSEFKNLLDTVKYSNYIADQYLKAVGGIVEKN